MNESWLYLWIYIQIETYAAAFREGDAVKMNGEWREVTYVEGRGEAPGHFSDGVPLNYIDRDWFGSYEGVAESFIHEGAGKSCEIIAADDCMVREGNELIWLGGSGVYQTFGDRYHIFDNGVMLYFYNDRGHKFPVTGLERRCWAVIPKYENVRSR